MSIKKRFLIVQNCHEGFYGTEVEICQIATNLLCKTIIQQKEPDPSLLVLWTYK